MTKEQEDKIIAQAQDILERRMAAEMDIKINLQNLVYYGVYYMGAIDAVIKTIQTLFENRRKPKGEDWIYLEAEWVLVTSSKRNMQLWLEDTPIRYSNHKRNKKGEEYVSLTDKELSLVSEMVNEIGNNLKQYQKEL